MNRLISKRQNKQRRQHRVRVTVKNAPSKPRLSVNISNKHVAAQIIDDTKGITLVEASTAGKKATGNLTDQAAAVGKEIGQRAKTKKIKTVTFDRGSRLYHGRIKALAENARKEGLKF